jgi:hypothetical protein
MTKILVGVFGGLYQKNLAVIWRTRGLLLKVFVGLLNSGLLTVA